MRHKGGATQHFAELLFIFYFIYLFFFCFLSLNLTMFGGLNFGNKGFRLISNVLSNILR